MDLTLVSLVFDASDPEALAAVLAKYVVALRAVGTSICALRSAGPAASS